MCPLGCHAKGPRHRRECDSAHNSRTGQVRLTAFRCIALVHGTCGTIVSGSYYAASPAVPHAVPYGRQVAAETSRKLRA